MSGRAESRHRRGPAKVAAVFTVVVAVVSRPRLWWTAVVVAVRMVPRRWWTRAPFLPVPSPAYVRFRKEAYYGDPDAPFRPDDVLKYLTWVRDLRP